jgi:hypothetical protein
LFRAYVVAVQMMKDARPLCARIQAMPLLDAEKAVVPLPKEHPSELFITVGSYEFTDGNFRRLSSITGQSINGGVSISGRSLYATAVKFAPTLITQTMDQVLSRRTDQAEWQVSDRRFIAFNIEFDLPVAASQPYWQAGLHTKQSEISGSGATNMLLRGSFLLGVFSLFWYAFADSFSAAYSFIAGIPRNARFGKNQKVKNIPTNAYNSENKDHYNGPRTMPDLLARPLSDSKKEKNSSDSVPAIHAVEAKFTNATYYVNDVTITARGYDLTGQVGRSDALWVKERQPHGALAQLSTVPSRDQKKGTTYPDRKTSADSIKTEFKNVFFNRTINARIAKDIESEFKKVFADETDEYREQLIAQRKKLSGCNRHEAMRRAIVERPTRLW